MLDESLDAVFSMVEKAFMRLQAGDVLVSCLEKDDTLRCKSWWKGWCWLVRRA